MISKKDIIKSLKEIKDSGFESVVNNFLTHFGYSVFYDNNGNIKDIIKITK